MTCDPRVARTREIVLDAAADLVLEVGCERLTIDEVAARSGVARSTIYRNWGDKSALLVDVVGCVAAMPTPPDTGSLEGDLEVIAAALSGNLLTGNLGRILPSMISAAADDDELRQRQTAMADARFAVTRSVFERAVLRGEISPTDLDGRIERFMAPFFTRHLLHGWPLDDDFLKRQVAAAILA